MHMEVRSPHGLNPTPWDLWAQTAVHIVVATPSSSNGSAGNNDVRAGSHDNVHCTTQDDIRGSRALAHRLRCREE